jgi:hypothetical protein
MFNSTVYIKVSENKFWLRHIESGKSIDVVAVNAFSTTRLLVGDFTAAETVLKPAIKQIINWGLLTRMPEVLIQPLEKIEGGLSQVEERTFLELALLSGARKAKVYIGSELSDEEVKLKLKGK